MDMVKVDPKLFVTCRLCLEEMGMYQITPAVQSQIKYCFDIDVDQFDGLPQLICHNCQEILSEYCTKKRIFVGRQNALKARVEIQKDIEENSVSQKQDTECLSQTYDSENPRRRKSITSQRQSYRESSITSWSDVSSRDHRFVHKQKHSKKSFRTKRGAWEACYKRMYVCRICQGQLSNLSNCKRHIKIHTNIVSEYEDIFYKPCSVTLEKIDGRPNLAADSNVVVLNPNKIIKQHERSDCYVLYVPNNAEQVSNVSGHESENSDGDSDFDVRKPASKRQRILSNSSHETMVLTYENRMEESDSETQSARLEEKPDSDIDCINIDDSSNSSNSNLITISNSKETAPAKYNSFEDKTVKQFLAKLFQRYFTQQEKTDTDCSKSKALMEHKLLSMGLKIMGNQQISCTGLLRYMEHKYLEIKWVPSPTNGNPVRIMPKLKEACTSSDELGWKKVTNVSFLSSDPYQDLNLFIDDSSCKENTKVPENTLNGRNKDSVDCKPKNNKIVPVESKPFVHEQHDSDKKLLNANPVANPKQLPKKSSPAESKFYDYIDIFKRQLDSSNFDEPNHVPAERQEDSETCMPIITSTTSLAVPSSTGDDSKNIPQNATTDSVNAAFPRIKVKPASELMSDRVLNSYNNDTHVSNNISNEYESSLPKIQNTISLAPSIQPSNQNMTTACNSLALNYYRDTQEQSTVETVILDTVEFPNTRTDSPFRYLKNLLKIHHINLLDYHEEVPRSLDLLIKFKLQFSSPQSRSADSNQVVKLSLAVHCGGYCFLLTVRDLNEKHIDLNKLSANWQWEIIKNLVKEDIVKRMLKNASNFGMSHFGYTKTFLCLLKSINFQLCDR